jgi:hypothetical protein
VADILAEKIKFTLLARTCLGFCFSKKLGQFQKKFLKGSISD